MRKRRQDRHSSDLKLEHMLSGDIHETQTRATRPYTMLPECVSNNL